MLYIINLPERVDRRKTMMAQLEQHGITQYKFIDAVNGYLLNEHGKQLKTMDWELIDKYITQLKKDGVVDPEVGDKFKDDTFKYPQLKPGEIGCDRSHRLVFQDALENKYDQITVLEDDAIILDASRLYDATPGLTYLGIYKKHYHLGDEDKKTGLFRVDGVKSKPISTKNRYFPAKFIPGLHGYTITAAFMRRFLARRKIRLAIDVEFSVIFGKTRFAQFPFPVTVNRYDSNIQIINNPASDKT